MNCTKCQREIPDDAVFCCYCGKRLVAAPPKPRTGKRGSGQGSARKRGSTWTAVWTVGFRAEGGKLKQLRHYKGGFQASHAQRLLGAL